MALKETSEANVQPGNSFLRLPDQPGCYLVTTSSGTRYLFNRADYTVTRIPAPGASPSVNDGVRRIRTVESCTVGEPGFWTMHSNDPDVDWYWQRTTAIVSIIETTAGHASPAPSAEAPATSNHRNGQSADA
ncbi:hypothetical protein [Leifsonia shinshuensis]|uniref:Uncharacterized protein n=1 Tax=Leifsonia shinshuensis TaxID=150026 RepID=A0A7G6YA50_9MICO|nr:hypothetical protein [Leifsonia shinshuensis]QNE35365.1 hypothetical protein F1C12_09645 [Leifsonia shinshuensis]